MREENKGPVFNIDFKILKDDDEMPYGKYKGRQMIKVPADYMLWLNDNDKCNKSVKAYIVDNWEALHQQAGRPLPVRKR